MSQKELWIKSIKVTMAALLSIMIAGRLGLQFSATAGIITILSIQNTKKETLHSALNRGLAFICALLMAAVIFRIMGFSLPGFGIFLLLFSLLCHIKGWTEAITMDSVLITHFLSEKSMSPRMLGNETALFLVGTGIGILVNLHLRRKEEEFQRLSEIMDMGMRKILSQISQWLLGDFLNRKHLQSNFDSLSTAIKKAELCAVTNYNNALFYKDTGEMDYVQMREEQYMVLQSVYEILQSISYLPQQAYLVGKLTQDIERDYHRDNTVEGLLAKTEVLFEEMKKEELPKTREEFEVRALLFYILIQFNKFLNLKRRYVEKICKKKDNE